MSESSSLAIIGMSCLFPQADDLRAYWSNIKNGVDAITQIPATHWNIAEFFDADPKAPDRTYARRGGFLSPVNFNPMEFGIAPKDVEATDTTQLLGMVAAKQALVDAGYGEKPFPKERTSVILGVTGALELVIPLGARLGHPIWRKALKEAGVGQTVADDVVRRIADSYVGWQENSFPGLLGNVAAGRIANRLDLGGTNCVVDAACASSLAALHLAMLELAAGRSDMVITGGLDTFNDIFMYMCFSKTPALSPTGDAKPFDRNCDGTMLGEGLGMLVMKRVADAERDGDRIYAVIQGLGSSSDGRGNAIYAPQADGQKEALRRAYAEAGVTPDSIELVEAHGTGTRVGDAAELQALTEVFRSARPHGTWAALGSVKSQIGHTKAAAGVAGLIKAALALDRKVLPPTIKVSQPIEEAAPGRSPFYVNTQKRPWLPREGQPRRAGVSSFGFGGTNFHCVLKEHSARKSRPDWDGDVEIIALSADRREDLRAQLTRLPAGAPWSEVRTRARHSRTEFKPDAACRLLLVAAKGAELGTLRDAAVMMLENHPEKASWQLPAGAAFGSGPCRGKLAALFPGQGSQYVGMFRDLACQFPEMMDALADGNAAFAEARPAGNDGRLSDYIYPYPVFSDAARREQEEALKATDVAQPALGAVGLGAMSVLASFGVTAEAAVGHSYGELLALCGAGRILPESLHLLSNARGRLMARGNGNGDRGGMLAVQASEAAVTSFVSEQNSELVVANRNSPSQFVLAGPKPQIEHAASVLAKRSVRARVLPVAAAFHSSMVADAREPFAAVLEQVAFDGGRIPVYANSTAQAYPSEAKSARELLANQIVRPVNFMAQIETMHRDGITTFVEMGPGHVLSDLVQSILAGREAETIALDASRGSRAGVFDLALALCRLAALGHTVDLSRWEDYPAQAGPQPNGKPGLTIPLTGANHRSPAPKRPVNPPVNEKKNLTNATPPPPRPVAAANPPRPETAKVSPAPAAPEKSNVAKTVPSTGQAQLPPNLASALALAQQGMLALERLQEQTAQVHRQFLEGQEAARRSLENLLAQRRQILHLPASSLRSVVSQPLESARVPVAPPAPVAVSTVHAPTTAAAPAPSAALAEAVLEVVAEKTGYPAEMLNLEMGLDSDLGVDSIKRVEIMAALRARVPAAPEIKPEHLGTLQTLQQVVDFLAGDTAASVPGKPISVAPVTGQPDPAPVAAQAVLEVVAEKTGYPVEMLNLGMGLDSDLGVDSIKRVEIMAALRARLPAAPEIRPEHLGALQTLQEIVDFLAQGTEAGAAKSSSASASLPVAARESSAVDSIRAGEAVLRVVAEKTGYPVEMLNLDMGLDSDLGVDSIKRVEIMAALRNELPSAPEVKPEHLGTLQTLRQVVEYLTVSKAVAVPEKMAAPASQSENCGTNRGVSSVETTDAPSAAKELHRQLVKLVKLGGTEERAAIQLARGSQIWVTEDGSTLAAAVEERLQALGYAVRRASAADLIQEDRESELPSGLVILWPAARGRDEVLKESFRLIQVAGPSLRRSRGILVTISRLDGVFGFGSLNGNGDPVSGGLAGLAKTARHEWPEVNCKAIDLNAEVVLGPEMASAIVEEMFLTGPVEVGLSGERRFSLQLETVPLNGENAEAILAEGDVVVVTGGARGITAAAALQLARRHRPKLVLLGRSELTEQEPEWLAGLTQETEIKKALLARANGNRSPKYIETKYREALAQREIREQLNLIRAAGATAFYHTVDVRSASRVKAALQEIRQELGPIRGLIHGAGVLADRRIEDKTAEQFDLVYGTKVAGLKNLLKGAAADDLRVLALFSSYSGRFGRTGQADYAAANEVLNKIAQSESRKRPQCRVVSFNWGPWNGGMVSEGLRKVFETEGVGLIEPDAGAEFFVREISARTESSVEVLALAPAPNVGETFRPSGSIPEETPGWELAFQREVSVKSMPCMASHVMNGRAVLPAALMIEWLGHGAMHSQPGLGFHGFENFKVFKGLMLDPGSSAEIRVLTGLGAWRDGSLTVPVQLVSSSGGRVIPHARAEIILGEQPPTPVAGETAPPVGFHNNGHHTIYGHGQLFHGPHFQGIETLEVCSERSMSALVKSAPAPKAWIQQPLRPGWLADPLALDSSFQMMILWSWEHRQAGSLPCAIKRFRQFVPGFPAAGTRVVIQIESADTPVVTATLHFSDREGNLLARAEGYECTLDQGLRDAFRQNLLPHEG